MQTVKTSGMAPPETMGGGGGQQSPTGTSDQQLRSVAREMEDLGKQNNFKVFSRAGMQQGRWKI